MSDILVDTARRILTHEGREIPCLIGKGGTIPADAKREGDGATPLGRWPIRTILLRPDRVTLPPQNLPWRWLHPTTAGATPPRTLPTTARSATPIRVRPNASGARMAPMT